MIFAIYIAVALDVGSAGPHSITAYVVGERTKRVVLSGSPFIVSHRRWFLFATKDICEHYRPSLIKSWVNDPKNPFTADNVISTRCGEWAPDPDVGDDL